MRVTQLLLFADWREKFFFWSIRSGQFKRFWNWFGKNNCPGARLDLTVNFHHGHFIDPTNCPGSPRMICFRSLRISFDAFGHQIPWFSQYPVLTVPRAQGGTPLFGLCGYVPLNGVWFFGLAFLNKVYNLTCLCPKQV